MKQDESSLEWAVSVPTRYFASYRVCWQSIIPHCKDADLVVLSQENKFLHNYFLLLLPRRFKIALWGHGRNMARPPQSSWREHLNAWQTRNVDWWFAYTERTVEVVRGFGFPLERITNLNNAFDTEQLASWLSSISELESATLKRNLGLSGKRLAVFIGSFYKEKRLEFLFEAATHIRSELPDFHLLIIGDGPERDWVAKQCSGSDWASWVGPKIGREKALHLSIGDVLLNPGGVGLNILDAFVSGLPMFTTDCGVHGPEIAYLRNGTNGVITAMDPIEYAAAVIKTLKDQERLEELKSGCYASAALYTLNEMVARFAGGIRSALTV